MIIIKFRGKYIYLDNFKLGFAAYVATIGVIWVIEWRRNKKKGPSIPKFVKNTLTVRGGNFFVRRFLRKRLKNGTLYEVVDPRLIRYIRELTHTVDYKGIVYIDVGLLAYAVRTMDKPRPSEIVIKGVFKIFNPVRTVVSIVIGVTAAGISALIFNTSTILGSIALVMLLYTSPLPLRRYNDNLLYELKVNNQQIEYLFQTRGIGNVVVYKGNFPTDLQIYSSEGTIVPEKVSENENDASTSNKDKSIVVKHKPARKEYKFNRSIHRLKDLSDTITVDDFNESKDDAEYALRNKEREGIRIRIRIKNGDSE